MPVRAPDQAIVSTVSVTTSPVNISLSNSGRKGLLIHNASDQTMFIKFGAEPSSTSYTASVPKAAYYELPGPCYTGLITAIWAEADADGFAAITELM